MKPNGLDSRRLPLAVGQWHTDSFGRVRVTLPPGRAAG